MKYLLFLLLFYLTQCNSAKVIMICGKHKCIDKKEAQMYFEDNLTIEVQVIDKKKEKTYDLVLLNTKPNFKNKDSIKESNKKKEKIIILNKEEVKLRKKEIKELKKAKTIQKKLQKKEKSSKVGNNISKKVIKTDISQVTEKNICLVVEKCDIETISNYLMKKGLEKSYPNIN